MDPDRNRTIGATYLTLGKNEVQEAVVISSNAYSGQYGQQAGAQITYITRSAAPTNHGNVLSGPDPRWTPTTGLTTAPARRGPLPTTMSGPRIGRTDPEGQTFLRWVTRLSSTSFLPPSPSVTNAADLGINLANPAATAPAEVALYQRYSTCSAGEGIPGTNREYRDVHRK